MQPDTGARPAATAEAERNGEGLIEAGVKKAGQAAVGSTPPDKASHETAAAENRTVMIGGEKVRYVDPLTDWGFKTLFGTEVNKENMLALLRAIFPGRKIRDISYIRNENLGATESDRRSVFDVVCLTEAGEQFVVEVQKKDQEHFRERALYYSTFPIREQGRRGGWDYSLSRCTWWGY